MQVTIAEWAARLRTGYDDRAAPPTGAVGGRVTQDDLAPLVERARTGDREAAAVLAPRLAEAVRGTVRKAVGRDVRRRVDTDDIVQSTVTSILTALPDFEYRGERAFFAWVQARAQHAAIDAMRHHRAGMRDVGRERSLDAAGERPAGRTSPSQAAVRTETREVLRDAVARLPEPDRDVVRLHSFEGLAFPVVAERLGLADAESARSVFRRALIRLGGLIPP